MKYLLIIFLLISFNAVSQSTYYIQADTVKFRKVGGNAEFILENATRTTKGILTNYSNGRTRFIKPRISMDTLFIGVDTLLIPSSGSDADNGLVKAANGYIGLDSNGVNPLTRDVEIDGAANNKNIRISSENMELGVNQILDLRNNGDSAYTWINSGLKLGVQQSGNTNYTIIKVAPSVVLEVISASRNVTFPILEDLKDGYVLLVHNINSNGFSWNVSGGAAVAEADNTPITTIPNETMSWYKWDGISTSATYHKWVKVTAAGGSSVSFGTDNQIPFTNSGGTNFDYSSTFTYDGTTLNVDGAATFNEAGANVDFRVEGDADANALFVDASADAVGIGTNAPGAKLQIEASSGSYLLLAKLTGGSANRLELERTTHGILRLSSENGDQDANIIFSAGVSGSNTRPLWYTGRTGGDPSPFQIRSYHPSGAFFEQRLFIQAQGEMVINEGGLDRDTRIESDNDANALFVDASADGVGFGTNSPGAKVHASATSGKAIYGTATGANPVLEAIKVSATTNAVVNVAYFSAQSSGTAAAGFGPLVDFYSEAGDNSNPLGASLRNPVIDATAGTFTTSFDTWVMSSNTITRRLRVMGIDGVVATGRLQLTQGADVASAAGAIAVGSDGNVFELTGTAAVTLISNINWQNGAQITFIFTSTATLTDGTANTGTDIGMELAGNANFVGSADDAITLVLSEIGGVQRWRELSRTVN